MVFPLKVPPPCAIFLWHFLSVFARPTWVKVLNDILIFFPMMGPQSRKGNANQCGILVKGRCSISQRSQPLLFQSIPMVSGVSPWTGDYTYLADARHILFWGRPRHRCLASSVYLLCELTYGFKKKLPRLSSCFVIH